VKAAKPTPDINKILSDDPRYSPQGAPMGDRNMYDGSIVLYLQRVRFVDGDYAPDGTYWGGIMPLWCAFNPENAEFAAGHGTRIYVRAATRDAAKAAVKANYVNVRFYR
jgi:hypothetical protein